MAEETSPREADGTAVFAHQGPGDELVPAGFRLRPDPGARTLADGTVITGGYPIRVLRLSPAGARHVAGWWDGAPVPGNAKARALARRLLDTGIAHPVLDKGRAERPEVTVVIPVRDRHAELARCLAGLAGTPRVIVVDDGSADPAAIQSAAAAAGASVVRRPVNGGPAAARNTGLAAAQTPLVAFLDSDCVPGAAAGWTRCCRTSPIPRWARSPRASCRTRPGTPGWPGTRGRAPPWTWDGGPASSGRDHGCRTSPAPPWSSAGRPPGPASPRTCRWGRTSTSFWRLAASGWRVRYEPAATMGHQHRVRLREWFSRRKDYGTSAATLELRHPGAVRPLYASAWTAAAWLAAAFGRPEAGAVVTGTGTALLARRLARVTGEAWPIPAGSAAWRLAVAQAAGGTLAAARPLGSAICRTWWPVAVPAAIAVRRLRLPLAALVLAPPLLDWLDRRPPLDPARYVAARLLDDAGYSVGVWQGCVERRTVRPLLPVLRGRDRHLCAVIYAGPG